MGTPPIIELFEVVKEKKNGLLSHLCALKHRGVKRQWIRVVFAMKLSMIGCGIQYTRDELLSQLCSATALLGVKRAAV